MLNILRIEYAGLCAEAREMAAEAREMAHEGDEQFLARQIDDAQGYDEAMADFRAAINVIREREY
ncbi:MAG: hypothetical protein IPP13_21545 [Kouleothrix sp.]|jgi:hypothetical protein|nr:hypothetical protein [Kouleothrix sp.]